MILIMFYLAIGIAIGWWGFSKLEPYFYTYEWTFLLAIVYLFFCLGFIPIYLCMLTFRAY